MTSIGNIDDPRFETWKKLFGFAKFVEGINNPNIKLTIGAKFVQFMSEQVLPKQKVMGGLIDIPKLVLSYLGINQEDLSREEYAKLIRYFHAFCELAEAAQ